MPSPVIQMRIPEDVVLQLQELAEGEKVSVPQYCKQVVLDHLVAKAAAPLVETEKLDEEYNAWRDMAPPKNLKLARIPKSRPSRPGALPADFGLKPPAKCNRGFCPGTLHPTTGRCTRCNQKPREGN